MGRLIVLLVLAIVGCRSPQAPAPTPTPVVPPSPSPPIALVSPGPLTAAHGTLACLDCHDSNSKETLAGKCLACHDNLSKRIGAGHGFHASPGLRGRACASCHLDHRGATFDPTGWSNIAGGMTAFDHALTGWPLGGAHAKEECTKCHQTKTTSGATRFIGQDRMCGSCHRSQPHGFQRRDMLACERCHTEAEWKPAKPQLQFDHDNRRDAVFPTIGVHATVACVKCHPSGSFDLPQPDPASCGNCHATPKSHVGQMIGQKPCAWCHSPTVKTFAQTSAFDHSERTKFDLGASHDKLACTTCHTKALGLAKPAMGCESCHAKRAVHKDRFKALGTPPPCGSCHAPKNVFDPKKPARAPWPVASRADHRTVSKWPLNGKHATLACRTCHRGSKPTDFEVLADGNQCMSCHAHKTVHVDAAHPNGQYANAQCRSCHPTER